MGCPGLVIGLSEASILLQLRSVSQLEGLTLYGWFPRTTLLPLLLSVNHFHVAELTLVAAAALGNLCLSRTVVLGPDIHL